MNKSESNLYIIAGPNGAGKTTFAKEFLPKYAQCKNFVNADLIAQGLAPFNSRSVEIKAGKILLRQIHELAQKCEDFSFETTLSGKSYLPFLKKLKKQGYYIHLFFLWIPNVELALKRIRERVANGGHNIPSKDVRRRFSRSINNFVNYYKPLLDMWMIFDNSAVPPHLIAKAQSSKLEILDENLFNKIIQKGSI
ncbi:MAG: zeta toxin family protein [Candidatus Omnitrophota bacterium]|nr:MAG: zeta toxin family protein [Candidatus Omnitrophota bacterium]